MPPIFEIMERGQDHNIGSYVRIPTKILNFNVLQCPLSCWKAAVKVGGGGGLWPYNLNDPSSPQDTENSR